MSWRIIAIAGILLGGCSTSLSFFPNPVWTMGGLEKLQEYSTLEGPHGKMLSFDGVDDIVSQLAPYGEMDSISLEIFAYPMEPENVFVKRGVYVETVLDIFQVGYNYDDNTYYCNFFRQSVVGEAKVPLEKWRHVVCTYTGKELQVFENGVLLGEVLYTMGEEFPNDGVISLGSNIAKNAKRMYSVYLGEVRLYYDALHPEHVEELFAVYKEHFNNDWVPPSPEKAAAEFTDIVAYEAIDATALRVERVATGVISPTRIAFSPDGAFMLVTQLTGEVLLFTREEGNSWKQQEQPYFTAAPLGVKGERGMTSVFFSHAFNASSNKEEDKDIFFTFQIYSEDRAQFVNRVVRTTFTKQDGVRIASNPVVIYEGAQPAAPAHQVQEGISFSYEGAPHILVIFSDAFSPAASTNLAANSIGKMLLMQRDGTDPLGPRPWPKYPKTQSIGIRNPYSISMLPKQVDPLRRIMGVENGNLGLDRIWLLELIDFGHEVDAKMNLGWKGDDLAPTWISVEDQNSPTPIKNEGVLVTLPHGYSPNGLDFHPGKGMFPPQKEGETTVLVSYLGRFRSTDTEYKGIAAGTLTNLSNQAGLELQPIIQRTAESEKQYGSPLDVVVDPITKDIYFGDIIRGEIYVGIILPQE